MRFQWIEQHGKEFEVRMMCRMLQVSRSGYYAWRDRPVSGRRARQEQLTERIREIHAGSRRTYGSPRVHAELLDRDVKVCLNTVAKLMKQAQIRAKTRRRFVVRTTDSGHAYEVFPNRLDRRFDAQGPNQKWCCDITYVPTQEGFLYLAAVMDLYSRKIVGWSMADHLRTELCLNALEMALAARTPDAGLLHHSDRGVQYASDQYRQRLESNGIQISMSRSGDCYDNAVMESFFHTLKIELIYQQDYATQEQARQSIFEYIECWYNRRRRHSAIGYQSPDAFEAASN
jgi:putative transposase